MANTSNRILILTAFILAVIIGQFTWMNIFGSFEEKEGAILTWEDLEIQISTSRDCYTLGEGFTATVYLVNNHSKNVRMEPITSCNITGKYENGASGGRTGVSWTPAAGSITILPAHSRKKLVDKYFTPEMAGDFTISSLGASRTVHVLYNESDVAEIIRLSLILALVDKKIPDYNLIKDKQNIVLCTENIVKDWVYEVDGINLIMLNLDKIQSRADREGDFLYLRFTKLDFHNEQSAIVKLDNVWMKKRGSPYMYLSGGGLSISFNKESGTWNGIIQYYWIS